MTRREHIAGLIVAASIPLFILPARISEGQWNDPVNLIGSELVIFLMSLTCWYCLVFIQHKDKLPLFAKLLFSLVCCCALSNVFYFTFNPIFKDFPFRTAQNPLLIKILMLSSRGILMSVILIPAAYYVKKEQEARLARLENEQLIMERMHFENRLLEQAVVERTKALQDTLVLLQSSQNELEHQSYIQSRLIASITHDIRGPFKFVVQVSEKVAHLAANTQAIELQSYTDELNKSLGNMLTFVDNLLEFTKLPLKQKISKSENVNLFGLVREKASLFHGTFAANKNALIIDVDEKISVKTNFNLLGIILHNLIDNANKHTIAGKIQITLTTTTDSFNLKISNSGKLIADNIIDWINTRQNWADPESIAHTNRVRGIGLVLVKEIAMLLEIGLSMRSESSDTHVLLSFPKDEV
ncbi:sensor histidine kinase [Dyadobacter psychrotolerans]|uniref:histidine kinase n=1 Tax=Dyadobacter psychrotolerans TaxID=2541721 RepID=A0A4R5DCV3_9BACT|nr:HAMP domain-containing sensor histidine kinase [Dyadobacter psychrotolerans]TDE10837.1 HAMP domain-containing histidine kinase [Dyadobacter psychrotolerans]